MGQGQGQGLAASVGVSGGLGQGIGRARGTIGGRQKDGVFFRPLPCKGRSGSWGGYDRRRLMRRTRFDSIPEGLAEEEDDDLDQEVQRKGATPRCIYMLLERGYTITERLTAELRRSKAVLRKEGVRC